jgi:type I restriction enzyme S subunit
MVEISELDYGTVIISIKPEFVDKIISGEKKYEFRKTIWKKEKNIQRITIYSSSPVRKIVGFFIIEKILKGTPEAIWLHCQEYAGISEEKFFNYFNDIELAYAIKIGRLEIFKKPLDPKEMVQNFKAPQNFMYFRKNKC